jgi:hypothetical protein
VSLWGPRDGDCHRIGTFGFPDCVAEAVSGLFERYFGVTGFPPVLWETVHQQRDVGLRD